jgi:hypothetical protein
VTGILESGFVFMKAVAMDFTSFFPNFLVLLRRLKCRPKAARRLTIGDAYFIGFLS